MTNGSQVKEAFVGKGELRWGVESNEALAFDLGFDPFVGGIRIEDDGDRDGREDARGLRRP